MKSKNQDLMKQILKDNNIKNAEDLNIFMSQLKGNLVQELLEGEMDFHLGYDKNSHKNKNDSNRRNGYGRKKNVKTKQGPVSIKTPRDRLGTFEPMIVPKNKTIIDNIDDSIISCYAKGMSLRDIENVIKEAYGIKLSKDQLSMLISRINDDVIKWQNRTLKNVYVVMYIDCLYVPIKQDLTSIKKAVYVSIGIDLTGHKEVIGIWINPNENSESASFWTSIFEELKYRGVKDILFTSADGLAGYDKALTAVFPQTIYQRCMVHMVRNIASICSIKDRKEVINDFKLIYTSPNITTAEIALDNFIKKHQDKKSIIKKVESFYIYIEQLMEYPVEIRRLIYTSNAVESVNSCLRKVTKGKGSFPNETAVIKIMFLRIKDLEEKWSKGTKNWNSILFQLADIFKERVTKYL